MDRTQASATIVSMSRSPLGTAGTAAHEAIARLCAGDLAPLELLEQVARRVRSVVPYAAAGWLPTDPATLLHTGAFAEDVPAELHLRLIDNELTAEDFAKFSEIVRLPRPVLSLSKATEGQLERSARHRELYAPGGYRGELRAGFRAGGACWGVGCLTRAEGDPEFNNAEVDFVAGICEHVGHGLRTALLIEACQDAAVVEPPGMVVLRDDDALESRSGEAERWLSELPQEGLELPSVVYQVARRARARADAGGSGPPARARVRLPSGRWLLVHGARLHPTGGGAQCTAVVLEPARRADLAPLIVELYELTAREREVTQLLVSGTPIDAIAQSLWISQHTVRDHVKAIFAKLGVSTRPELTALLFHEHFLPGLQSGAANSAGTHS
jgi:DNA-binding CsgD family transcriptional regulator